MDINNLSPARHHQPSSFPFLLVTALLFYFFSKSPSTPDPQTRADLRRAFERRKLQVIGLTRWLNSNISIDHDLIKQSDRHSNLTQLPITTSLVYHPNSTFGSKSPSFAQEFINQHLNHIDTHSNIETPHLFWKNITGHIKGNWKWRSESLDWYTPSNHFNPTLNIPLPTNSSTPFNSSYISQRGQFPWSSLASNQSTLSKNKSSFPSSQKIGFNFHESSVKNLKVNASMIRGSMYISADNSKDVLLDIEGIHLLDLGRFYLRAYPSRVYLDTRIHLSSALDIPASFIPAPLINDSLVNPNPPTPQQSQIGEVIVTDLLERMRKAQEMLKKGDIPHDHSERGESDNDSTSNCTFIIYGSLTPLPTTPTQNSESLLEYENSFISPTGASLSIPNPAYPLFQSLMISPNCGLMLETSEMPVLLAPAFWAKGRIYGWYAGAVMGIQCWLLVWQMDSRQSPSSLSRMSYFALVSQIIMDAWTFSSHLTLSVVTNNISSQTLLIPAFFACLNAILFGMRYGTMIRMHTPTNPETTRPNTTENTIGRDTDYVQVLTADSQLPGAYSPLPVTPRARLHRVFANLSNLVAQRPFASVTIIAFLLVSIPFLLYSWQPLILLILYSYWVPQITHNVKHGTSRRGLRKRYVLGTTLCRLFLPLYVWACPTNVLFVEPNPWIWLLSLYSLLQAIILILQDYLGARFFLFGTCFAYEPIWDYHPLKLPYLNDLENGRSNGSEVMPECVICFESIDVLPSSPTMSQDERHSSLARTSEVGLFSRWSYMVPPCHHIAHTKCLENWLAIKSECPVCRRPLPPT
ncbi:hypothetical protein O181_053725 [Austropuccinia psidii MF-1]|uniref:RING-type E3 ubiquitin transferase n=1 Tax=Austropuccinia psidii MF-1 TaxID=1389203 RepID=A0A9Q3E7D9_9BASI|nr:hypothetical protein [Austropuccinia psidii MF-1]